MADGFVSTTLFPDLIGLLTIKFLRLAIVGRRVLIAEN